MSPTSSVSRLVWLGSALASAAVIACGGETQSGPTPPPPPPPPPSPTISATDPNSTPRETTLNVRVLGSAFDQGSRATWARNGDTTFATTKVKTNSTTFVSAGELVANITIQAEARLGSYDVVVVTGGGRKGTGAGLFSIALRVEAIDLGAGDNSVARGVNNRGQIVGDRGASASTIQGYLWENGVIRDLGVLPGMTYSFAFDINGSGQVVGVSGTGTIDRPILQQGFIWSATTGMLALSTLGGAIGSARAINDNGDIVGVSTGTGANPFRAVVWRKAGNGVITDLFPASFGPDQSAAFAINSQGEVVGWNYGRREAFHWTSTGVMASLGGVFLPFGINDAGCIVGWGGQVTEGYRLCGGVSLTLGSCGGVGNQAWAINSAGQVAGNASNGVAVNGGVQQVAFFWTEADGMACLPLPAGSDGAGVVGINDNGWVIGNVSRPVGGNRATLWKVR